MRNYIITDKEKEIIRRFLEDCTRLEGFSVLKNRVFNAYSDVAEDMIILNKFYTTIEDEAPPQVREKIMKLRELVKEHIEKNYCRTILSIDACQE